MRRAWTQGEVSVQSWVVSRLHLRSQDSMCPTPILASQESCEEDFKFAVTGPCAVSFTSEQGFEPASIPLLSLTHGHLPTTSRHWVDGRCRPPTWVYFYWHIVPAQYELHLPMWKCPSALATPPQLPNPILKGTATYGGGLVGRPSNLSFSCLSALVRVERGGAPSSKFISGCFWI